MKIKYISFISFEWEVLIKLALSKKEEHEA